LLEVFFEYHTLSVWISSLFFQEIWMNFLTKMDTVSNMLLEMGKDQKHIEIFKSVVFPDTAKMRESRKSAIVKCEYTCYNEQCDFTNCLAEIEKEPRVLKYDSSKFCDQIIRDISLSVKMISFQKLTVILLTGWVKKWCI
jgi:hypothetical protein